jgi:hypothetical protein
MIAQILDNKIKMNSDEIVMERITVNLYKKKVSSSQMLLCFLHQAAFAERAKLTAYKFTEVTISKQLSKAIMCKSGSIEDLFMKAVESGGIC